MSNKTSKTRTKQHASRIGRQTERCQELKSSKLIKRSPEQISKEFKELQKLCADNPELLKRSNAYDVDLLPQLQMNGCEYPILRDDKIKEPELQKWFDKN